MPSFYFRIAASPAPQSALIGENRKGVTTLQPSGGKFFRRILFAACLASPLASGAQTGLLNQEEPGRKHAETIKPSQPPTFSIPVAPLGFAAPASFFLGQRTSFVSLDFLDEDHLLFTFRVPGLLHRDTAAKADAEERNIRALVLTISTGAVESEALWTLHDRARYLYVLNDGHFLLRDRDQLYQGDATLALKPFLHFPGPLLTVDLDPEQQYLVTNSEEIQSDAARAGSVPTPATAAATVTDEAQGPAGQSPLLMRILRRSTGQVMLFSHVRVPVHLPINSEGYLEPLRQRGSQWLIVLNHFTGQTTQIGSVDSSCSPALEFLSEEQLLVAACNPQGGETLHVFTTGSRHLWKLETPANEAWPLVTASANGARFARLTLELPFQINENSPISPSDITGQLFTVYNSADGKPVLTAPVTPVLDAGGNAALSPSGGRAAVLRGGLLEIYTLSAPEAPPSQDFTGNSLQDGDPKMSQNKTQPGLSPPASAPGSR